MMPFPKEGTYTLDDIYDLPDGQRAELIDGQLYDLAPPSFIHRKLISKFTKIIGNHIDTKGDSCEVLPAPFAVFLNIDDKTHTLSQMSA